MRNSPLILRLSTVVIIGTLLSSFSASQALFAQENTNQDQVPNNQISSQNESTSVDESLQNMTVTGYIVPHGGEGPADVEQLGTKFSQDFGTQTVEDTLARLPNAKVTKGIGGQMFVALNGLDQTHTLVMMDGMRLPADPQNSGVGSRQSYLVGAQGGLGAPDISSIPLSALESTDVAYGGMSSLYGSDAMAGVVNFHLKTDYEGAELGASFNINRNGTGANWHFWEISGFTDHLNDQSKINFMETFDYRETSAYLFSDFAEYGTANLTKYGYQNRLRSQLGLNSLIGGPKQQFYHVLPRSNGLTGPQGITTASLPKNFNQYNIGNSGRRRSFSPMISMNYDLNQYINFHARYSFNESDTIVPYPYPGGSFATPLIVPTNNPYNPFGDKYRAQNHGYSGPVTLNSWDYTGARDGAMPVRTQTYTLATGFSIHNLPNDWFIKGDFNYSEVQTHQKYGLFPFSQRLLQEGLNGQLPGHIGQFINPFVDYLTYGDPNANLMHLALVDSYRNTRTQTTEIKIQAGGTLFELPSGPVTLGLNFEYNNFKLVDMFDKYITSGDINLQSARNFQGSRTIFSGSYQIDLPILGNKWSFPGGRALEFQVSQRYDQYSDFGSVAKPGFAMLYKPFDDFSLKASYQETFVAPQFDYLYLSGFTFDLPGLIDPRFKPNDPQYHPGIVKSTSIGNPNLKPETGYSYTLDAIWQPGSNDPEHSPFGFLNGLTVRVSYQNILDRNIAGLLSYQDVINLAHSGHSKFERMISRDPSGAISSIVQPYQNIASERIQNLMFSVDYATPEYFWGKIDLAFSSNYNISSTQQLIPGGPTYNETNNISGSTGNSPFNFYLNAFYSKTLANSDRFRTGLTMTYNSGAKYKFFPTSPYIPYFDVASWYTFDWQISYQFGKPEPVTPKTPKPGYDKDGKRLIGDSYELPKTSPQSWWRQWLAGTTVTFEIYNLFDAQLPMIDEVPNRFMTAPWGFGRSFMVQVEKKF